MQIKVIEIRDRATFIPAVAVKTDPANEGQRYLIRRSGYASTFDNVILFDLSCRGVSYDPYNWPGRARTFQVAHSWIIENFDNLSDGDVVDVEFIAGEKPAPCMSERFEMDV